MIKSFTTWLLISVFVPISYADEFPVVIGKSAYDNMPGLAEDLIDALRAEGLNATLKVVPGERALHLLTNGHAALDIIRHTKVMVGHPNLIQIDQPVTNIQLSRIVSSNQPNKCVQNGDDFSVVGVKGIRAFDGVIVPKFKHIIWAPTEDHAFRMIAAERADMTYWLTNRLDNVTNHHADTLTVCSEGQVNLHLHSYLHPSFEWAHSKVNKAYSTLFAN